MFALREPLAAERRSGRRVDFFQTQQPCVPCVRTGFAFPASFICLSGSFERLDRESPEPGVFDVCRDTAATAAAERLWFRLRRWLLLKEVEGPKLPL